MTLRRDLVRTDVQVANGQARIPQSPDPGVEVNEEIVDRHRGNR